MELKPIKQTFSVPYEYQLYFTKGLFHIENTLFYDIVQEYKPQGGVKILFVIDDGVDYHHKGLRAQIRAYCEKYDSCLTYTDTLVVAGGEQAKNENAHVEKVLQGINANAICRHSFVVVIGGGAVIDMVGYAAAIAHRGVKLIRIPTTVLSQNDSAVGVKNSINIFGKKNFLGTFAPPFAIINDQDFLLTLEQRDWISGVSEAIKVALIKDRAFFDFIAQNAQALKERDRETMQYLIYKCAEMHMAHIAQGGDPFEQGSSRPLDFGHWAAHKMEAMTHYTLRHGEAVAKGIALDVTYAQLLGLITKKDLDHILGVMLHIGFDLALPVETPKEQNTLLAGIEEFREHLGGTLTITLLSDIGKKHDVHTINESLMLRAMEQLNHQPITNP